MRYGTANALAMLPRTPATNSPCAAATHAACGTKPSPILRNPTAIVKHAIGGAPSTCARTGSRSSATNAAGALATFAAHSTAKTAKSTASPLQSTMPIGRPKGTGIGEIVAAIARMPVPMMLVNHAGPTRSSPSRPSRSSDETGFTLRSAVLMSRV